MWPAHCSWRGDQLQPVAHVVQRVEDADVAVATDAEDVGHLLTRYWAISSPPFIRGMVVFRCFRSIHREGDDLFLGHLVHRVAGPSRPKPLS